jgi:hypothetical protein
LIKSLVTFESSSVWDFNDKFRLSNLINVKAVIKLLNYELTNKNEIDLTCELLIGKGLSSQNKRNWKNQTLLNERELIFQGFQKRNEAR